MGGEGIYGGSFEDEFSRELYNGALSIVMQGLTNGSFRIVTALCISMLGQMQGRPGKSMRQRAGRLGWTNATRSW